MMYIIDLNFPTILIPCSLVPSTAAPGKTLCINENGESIVVEPNGTQVRTIPSGQPNWDSPWTQADLLGDTLVYRSSGGKPRGYKVIS